MTWEVNGTDEFADWFGGLTESEQDEVVVAVELLAEHGPELDRPYVDRIKGSQYHNMKELRPRGVAKNLRILFLFDPDARPSSSQGVTRAGSGISGIPKRFPTLSGSTGNT